jgi:predicted nucleotidyltransferase
MIVFGGAALVLLFHARESTKDVDAYFVTPEPSAIRTAAEAVAERLDLPSDWLNDAAKGYVVELTSGATLYESRALRIRAASTAQLLAMKLAAWRDAVDRGDARLLLSQIPGTADQIWTLVKQFVPPHLLDKASYAFEDLWETLHGSS